MKHQNQKKKKLNYNKLINYKKNKLNFRKKCLILLDKDLNKTKSFNHYKNYNLCLKKENNRLMC